MNTDRLSLAFGALADPTRRAILAQLAHSGEATVAALAAPHRMSSPAISKHLKVLERAGLVEVGRNASARPIRLSPLISSNAVVINLTVASESTAQCETSSARAPA